MIHDFCEQGLQQPLNSDGDEYSLIIRHNQGYILPACIAILTTTTLILVALHQQMTWQNDIDKNYASQQDLVLALKQDGQSLLSGTLITNSMITYTKQQSFACNYEINCTEVVIVYWLQHHENSNYQAFIAIGQKLSGFRSILAWHLMYPYR
jgi:hypothetical protein